MPDEHFFLAPEPPSLPPHLLHLLGEVPPAPAALYETKLPAADTAMQAALRSELQGLHGLQGLQGMQGVQGLPMSEGWQGLPLERSGAPGVEGLRLGACVIGWTPVLEVGGLGVLVLCGGADCKQDLGHWKGSCL